MIAYTKHAEDKLKRRDIKIFKISKRKIEQILKSSRKESKTKYGEYAKVGTLNKSHDLRIVYDIIDVDIKVITFHIARKGRY